MTGPHTGWITWEALMLEPAHRLSPLLLLVALITATASGGAAQELTISSSRGDGAAEVELLILPGADSGSFNLFFDNGGDQAVSLSGLTATLETKPGAPAGSTLVFTRPGESQPVDPLTLAAGTSTRLILQVDKLPPLSPGQSYGGFLVYTLAGAERRLPLTLKATEPSQLAVLGAQDGKLAVQVSSMPFTQQIVVQTADGKPAVDNLQLHLGPLSREDGAPPGDATLECEQCSADEPHRVNPAAPLAIEIGGDSMERATYTAQLLLSYQGRTESVELEITRGAPRENLEIGQPLVSGPAYFLCRVGFFKVGVCSRSSHQIKARVRETLGVTTRIQPPTIQLWRTAGEDDAVKMGAGDPVSPYRRACSGGRVSGKLATSLDPDGCADFVFTARGLKPGRYGGEVSVVGPDSKRVSKSFSFKVRHPALFVFVVILLGVVASYWLHRWATWGRAQALRALELAKERELLVANQAAWPDDDDRPVWIALSRQLGHLQRDNELRPELDGEAFTSSLRALSRRHLNFVKGLVSKEGIEEQIAALPKDKAVIRAELESVFDSLREAVASTATDTQPPLDQLAGLSEKARGLAILIPAKRLLTAAMKLREKAGTDDKAFDRLFAGAGRIAAEAQEIVDQRSFPHEKVILTSELRSLREELDLWERVQSVSEEADHLSNRLQGEKKQLATLRSELAKANRVLEDEGRSDDARRHLEVAEGIYARLFDKLPQPKDERRGRTLTPDQLRGPKLLSGGSDLLEGLAGAEIRRITFADERSPGEIARLIKNNQLIASGIVIVVAAISGLPTLWATEPTFGALTDYIAAFVWGFGFDAGSKVFLSFAGSTGVLPPQS